MAIVTSDIRPELQAPELLAPARVAIIPIVKREWRETIGTLTLYSLPVPDSSAASAPGAP